MSVRISRSRKWGFQCTQSTKTVTVQTSTFLILLLFLLWQWDTNLPFLGPFDIHVSLGLILVKVVQRLQIHAWIHDKRGRCRWKNTSLGTGKMLFCSLQHHKFPVWQQTQPRPAVGSSSSLHIHSVSYPKPEVKCNRTLHTQGRIQIPQWRCCVNTSKWQQEIFVLHHYHHSIQNSLHYLSARHSHKYMMPFKHCDIPFLQMAGNVLRYNICN